MPAEDIEERAEKARPAHIAALRQYLGIHPGDRDATTALAMLLPSQESDMLMSELVQRSPEDPEAYEARAQVRSRSGRLKEALDDFEMAGKLDAENPERFHLLGVVAYEAATKQAGLDEGEKRALIARGLDAGERAASLRADYLETLIYRSLLLREQAKLERDPAESRKLIDQADTLRQKALDLVNTRREKP
jgi:tetratricopeptide (TPR) repeat protein